MEEEQKAVEAATRLFYEAIEAMVSGRGLELMEKAWHHTDRVTTRHPMDTWSVGWTEIWETWKFVSTFGREDRGGSQVHELKCHLYGDVAYATVTFQASPAWGGGKIMCTNVLTKVDGSWKIVHHHADPSPAMQVALERMTAEG